jgi:ABC-type phosphate/phosphonate transport system permease subunit
LCFCRFFLRFWFQKTDARLLLSDFTLRPLSRAATYGYTVPLIPMALLQTLVTCLFALIFGLSFSANILLAAVVSIVPAFLYFNRAIVRYGV